MALWVGIGVLRGLPTAETVGMAVALTALPIIGLWDLFGRRLWGLLAAALLWPALLFAAFPGYFPGELGDALATGFSVFASPAGRDAARSAAASGKALAASTPGHSGTLAPPPALAPARECPPAITLGDDQVALPYEGQGHSMIVPVQFGDAELPMLFDTGASFTTLNAKALATLGVRVAPDAPEVTLHTANGAKKARLTVIPKAWVGGLPVEGVTVALCEECADDRVSGLLGLNVSGQFFVTIDTAAQQVLFQARPAPVDRVNDVQPWLTTEAAITLFADGRGQANVTAENHGARRVDGATVGIHCGDHHLTVDLPAIAPGETSTAAATLPADAACQTYTVTLDHARW